jgi:predicted nucleotide-binding protein
VYQVLVNGRRVDIKIVIVNMVDKIENLIEQLATLKSDEYGSIQFKKWERNVKDTLRQLPVDSERYIQEFTDISYNNVGPLALYASSSDWTAAYQAGLDDAQILLESCRDNLPLSNQNLAEMEQKNSSISSLTNDVFIVHGHDEEMKQAVARTLNTLKLNPIILHEQPNRGATIIEKFERNTDVQFAIILLSPDDMAFPKSEDCEKARPRPRQNVILELGYFVGKLSRDKVFALKRGDDLELPTDISGIIYTPYDSSGSWRFQLVKELKAIGYSVDANDLLT